MSHCYQKIKYLNNTLSSTTLGCLKVMKALPQRCQSFTTIVYHIQNTVKAGLSPSRFHDARTLTQISDHLTGSFSNGHRTPGMINNSDTDGSVSSPSLWASTITPSVNVDFTSFLSMKPRLETRPMKEDISLDESPPYHEPLDISLLPQRNPQAISEAPNDTQMALDFVLE
jgi:hypothetical protein